MEVSCLSTAYRVRRLEEADVPQILRLCSGNPQFYQSTACNSGQRTCGYTGATTWKDAGGQVLRRLFRWR